MTCGSQLLFAKRLIYRSVPIGLGRMSFRSDSSESHGKVDLAQPIHVVQYLWTSEVILLAQG